jgi:hypothetical protein
MQQSLGWDRPLGYRRGAAHRLRSIELYHDFDWAKHFPDQRAQFRGGQNLAELVIRESPPGKQPAILLTDRDVDALGGNHTTDTHHVVVINLPDYVKKADEPGTANAYLVELLGGGVTRATRLSEVSADDAEEAARWLDQNLDVPALTRWVGDNEERLRILREIAASATSSGEGADITRAIEALGALDGIEPDLAEAIAELASVEEDLAGRIELLWALTEDEPGRAVAAEMLRDRLTERFQDARGAADEFESLLKTAGETEIQNFIERNPWLLGLEYAAVRPRQPVVRGAVDFLLERFDGFHDLLELKSPGDALFEVSDKKAEIRSPSKFRLSKPLALALAQVHAYRDVLREEPIHEKMYGLRNTRDPRITILVGCVSELDDQQERLLHELNCSLHNVEIVPFDLLARRARAVLDNAERYFSVAEEDTHA